MSLDKFFAASILKGGKDVARLAIDRGVDDEYLTGDGLKAWQFIRDHLKQYHEVPDIALVEGRLGIKLGTPPPAPDDYYVLEILNRKLYGAVGEQLSAINAIHLAGDPNAAYQAFEDGVKELRKLGIGASKTVSLPSLAPDFLKYYEKLKAGYMGILTPWPSVNDATLGFWPEDFVLYVARMGIGKTWALTIIANDAWAVQGKRVLFVTTEMGREKIFQRWVAVHFKYPYNELRRGKLSAFAEQKMYDRLNDMMNDEGLYIIGGDFDFRIESLEGAIEECEPDIVFVDGAYLLKTKGDGRIERAANSFDELKRTAKRNRVPLVASTQFNREVKVNKLSSVGPEKIALSDAAGWNADLIYGLVRTDDMVKDKRMIQLSLKFREGEGEDVETHWDFDNMNFDELPKGQQAPTAAPTASGGGQGGSGGSGGGSGGSGGGSQADPAPYGTLFDTKDGKDVPF